MLRFDESHPQYIVDLPRHTVYRFIHRCMDAVMHTLTAGLGCRWQASPVSLLWWQLLESKKKIGKGVRC